MYLLNCSEGYSGILLNKIISKFKMKVVKNQTIETKIRRIKYQSKKCK